MKLLAGFWRAGAEGAAGQIWKALKAAGQIWKGLNAAGLGMDLCGRIFVAQGDEAETWEFRGSWKASSG
ncbi:unnamed protein product [Prunus armeniaca]|nr:hypothetical protein GBA52_008291 [Prunus armeniaca]